jgi:hypothetical protein
MALVVCWRNVVDSIDGNTGPSTSDKKILDKSVDGVLGAKKDLVKVGRLFVKVVQKEMDMKSELGPLIEVNPGLKELFGL